jgi:glyoxylase-like metal-dependent hydrolase (beta-lactamase superfamily II)
MKMHFLSGGRLSMRRSVYYPGAAKEETVELPVLCTLLRHGQGNVLFDTGCSPEAATNPEARWGGVARAMRPIFSPDQAVISQLRTVGFGTDDIDLVICSHLHPDHCGCNEHFKRATIFCHADELAAARSEQGPAQGYLPREWDQPQSFETFAAQKDVFGDGRIVLLPVPGHTPGMTAALVALDDDGAFLLASDAIPVEANCVEGYAPKNSWHLDKATAAIAELKTIASGRARIIYGHDDAQWKTLRVGAQAYQ